MVADTNDLHLLYKQPYRNKYSERDQGRLREIYAFVDKNYHRIKLRKLATYPKKYFVGILKNLVNTPLLNSTIVTG
tara:strand:+ start:381 stop:608 length:228 start_codon:yes stop_codon:yes gene_type:complete